MDAGRLAEAGAEAEADGRVVVAAGQDDRDAVGGQRGEGGVQHLHRVQGRDGPVVDVTGHDDGVGAVGDRLVVQPGQELPLVLQQALAVQGAPEMPVRGVD